MLYIMAVILSFLNALLTRIIFSVSKLISDKQRHRAGQSNEGETMGLYVLTH